MHVSLCAYRSLVFVYWLSSTNFFCSRSRSKTLEIAQAPPSPVEAYACRSISTPNCIMWVYKLDFEKLEFVLFQSD